MQIIIKKKDVNIINKKFTTISKEAIFHPYLNFLSRKLSSPFIIAVAAHKSNQFIFIFTLLLHTEYDDNREESKLNFQGVGINKQPCTLL